MSATCVTHNENAQAPRQIRRVTGNNHGVFVTVMQAFSAIRSEDVIKAVENLEVVEELMRAEGEEKRQAERQ